MRYVIVQGQDQEALVANIESFLKEQRRVVWEPVGRPFQYKENGMVFWAQAMWRTKRG